MLDAFIRENMLRRLFSFRRPKQEEKENATDNIQKENVDPNPQVQCQCKVFICVYSVSNLSDFYLAL